MQCRQINASPASAPGAAVMQCLAHLALLCLLGLGQAIADPWEALAPGGMQLRIVHDPARQRDGYFLERVYPGGQLDAGFGQQGATAFVLGADNAPPAALRVDKLGRPWVVGGSLGPKGRMQAVVLRFTPLGGPDAGYARQGRSALEPAGKQAQALDIAPAADGSAWVAGLLVDAQGGERIGWWRLRSDGSLDPEFGEGGLWFGGEAGETELLALAPRADGALVLTFTSGGKANREDWLLTPGSNKPLRLMAGLPAPPAFEPLPAARPAPPRPPQSPASAAAPSQVHEGGGREPMALLFALFLALLAALLYRHLRRRR